MTTDWNHDKKYSWITREVLQGIRHHVKSDGLSRGMSAQDVYEHLEAAGAYPKSVKEIRHAFERLGEQVGYNPETKMAQLDSSTIIDYLKNFTHGFSGNYFAQGEITRPDHIRRHPGYTAWTQRVEAREQREKAKALDFSLFEDEENLHLQDVQRLETIINTEPPVPDFSNPQITGEDPEERNFYNTPDPRPSRRP